MASLYDLSGRTALITGASRGIGAAIAEALAAQGANIALHHSSAADARIGVEDAAKDLSKRIAELGSEAFVVDLDLRKEGAATKLLDKVNIIAGRPEIVVSCASIQIMGALEDMDSTFVDQQFQMNFGVTVELARGTMPAMAMEGWGRFLAIGSVQQYRPSARMPVYSATKAAQFSFVQYLAAQFADSGVTANSISPGLIETDRNAFRRTDPKAWEETVRSVCPMGRAGQPEDIKGAALLLCSDAGAYITGADIPVNGGMLLQAPQRY